MAIKLTLSELKSYIVTESKRLYKLAVLKEKIVKNLSESTNQDYTSTQFYSAEELKQIRQNLIKKAAGWAFPEDTKVLSEKKYSNKANDFIGKEISHLQKDKDYSHDRAVAAAINIAKDKGYKVTNKTNEIDKSAMQAAKDDIQKSGGVFKPLGQSEFEKHINKNNLKKAMSPERMGENEIPTDQALKLTNKTIETVKSWVAADGSRKASNKIIDYFLKKWLELTSSDFPDTTIFANGIDEIEEMINTENYVEAFLIAKDTAREMINDIQEF